MLHFLMFKKKYMNSLIPGHITQEKIKYHKIKLGSKLVVEINQVAYIATKKKIFDKFTEGNYELQCTLMPKITKVCNLNKSKSHKGKEVLPKYFKGKIIFLNQQDYSNFDFNTSTILLFDRLDEFKFKLVGKYDFQIINYDTFAKFVAKKTNGNKDLIKKLNKFVSKKIRYEFHKEKFEIENFLFKKNEVFGCVIEKLDKRLEKIGIKLKNPRIDYFNIDKKNQEKINEQISNGNIKIFYKNIGDNDVVSE